MMPPCLYVVHSCISKAIGSISCSPTVRSNYFCLTKSSLVKTCFWMSEQHRLLASVEIFFSSKCLVSKPSRPYNRSVAQIPQCIKLISHNAPFCNRKCAHVCTFLLQNGALWDICPVHCRIWEKGLFHSHSKNSCDLRHICNLVTCSCAMSR